LATVRTPHAARRAPRRTRWSMIFLSSLRDILPIETRLWKLSTGIVIPGIDAMALIKRERRNNP
jgi:hypothetical protein